MPQSLAKRAFLLIVVLIFVSLTTSATIFSQVEREPRAQQLAQLVISAVNLTRAAILSAAPEWRDALLAELAEAEGMRIGFASDQDKLTPLPDRPAELALMVEKAKKRLGDKTRFASERNGIEGLWVSFFIGNDEFWIALPPERLERSPHFILMVWGGIILLLSMLGAYFIARQVAAPLKRLASAATEIGQGRTPEPLPEAGAYEIATVSRAFNQMSTDLATNEKERAVVLAGISHDLRTPLARIRLAGEMAEDDFLREEIAADVEHMDSVIQQFLDYARLNENETPEVVDLSNLVQETASRFKKTATQLDIDIQHVGLAMLRPVILKRAVANIIDNGIKYGGGHISVKLIEENGIAKIAISDHGNGIPESQLEAVKRPFIRLDEARTNTQETATTKPAGTGLGLAVVERAARLHHGEFKLENAPEGGLVAKLSFPLDQSV